MEESSPPLPSPPLPGQPLTTPGSSDDERLAGLCCGHAAVAARAGGSTIAAAGALALALVGRRASASVAAASDLATASKCMRG
jgi:hypothetical protein